MRLALGTQAFGDGVDAAEATRILDAFAEAGGGAIDTAPFFGGGTAAQAVVGRWLAGAPGAPVTVDTKVDVRRLAGAPGPAAARAVREQVEAGLRALGVERVERLWLYGLDAATPPQALAAAAARVADGTAGALGVSDGPAWVVARAAAAERIAAIQVEHGLLERSAEHELLPMAATLGLDVWAWGVLGGGVLDGATPAPGSYYGRLATGDAAARLAAVVAIARELGRDPAGVAIAWSVGRGVVPCLGPRRATDLRRWLARATPLPAGVRRRLDDATAPPAIVPHVYLRDPAAL